MIVFVFFSLFNTCQYTVRKWYDQ